MTDKQSDGKAVLRAFLQQWGGGFQLRSTHSKLHFHHGVLYNVDGSSDDPEINGESWKGLLIRNSIDGECYVTNVPAPADKTHPQFSVGGHMTTIKSGKVPRGGISYLMPLCSWHNHYARNHEAFELRSPKILKLFGYQLAEPAATFMARAVDGPAYSMVSVSEHSRTGWTNALTKSETPDDLLRGLAEKEDEQCFIMFEKVEKGGEVFYSICEGNVPD